ncbi:type I methionyl aminopeptidase [Candidatus Woesebacteria bacterium]|nr:type I methionyl aminopeptidase [Candidatus Woesebacteria bacterium]
MEPISIKTEAEIEKMIVGGKKLSRVKTKLREKVAAGVSAYEIETLADTLIKEEGAKASFKLVEGYSWATCININDGLVHGIPKREIVFKKGDVVSVDVGLFYDGLHTDTSFSVDLDGSKEIKKFLSVGQEALGLAIKKARVKGRIFDISEAIEEKIKGAGFTPIRALVGHGVGKSLHEEPSIPCFTSGTREESPEILPGMVLAIEVMYTQGSPEIVRESDGWTISTRDGKIASLFEETVAITPQGPIVLT